MLTYPNTRSEDVVDTLGGLSFPDPYRWLEADNDEVRAWQRRQAEIASNYVQEWQSFARLRELVKRFDREQKHGDQYRTLPRWAAGAWFRVDRAPGGTREQVIVSNGPMSPGRVLYDPEVERARTTFISWISPSPDGRTLAIGVCTDGSEANTIRLIDVASGNGLPDPPSNVLMDNWTGGAQWLPDSSGFFFAAITGSSEAFEQQVYLHKRASPPTTTQLDVPWSDVKDYRWVVVSRDGRHAVAMQGLVEPLPISVAELDAPRLTWKPFVTFAAGGLPGHLVGGRFIAVSYLGAARGRVVAIPLGLANPNDPAQWLELVPESQAVLRTITIVGDCIYLSEFVDTYARVRIFGLDGTSDGEVPLPERGALGIGWWYAMHSTFPRGHPNKFLFTLSSLTSGPGIYAHTPDSGLEVLRTPEVRLQDVVVEDLWARSKDGTLIPYHVVRHRDVDPTQAHPTLIYAYGGFNYPLVPQFPGPMAAFIASGGLFVHAHLRGGGEFGSEWARYGRMQYKQNCYDDLYAVAENLIERGCATPKTLALTGRSLGGHLCGVAATQRPDLWRVVVPRVPILDLVGACRHESYGRMAVEKEVADVDDADGVRRLATISPYHLVRDDATYPAIFLDVGATDPRCEPWHARKFAAQLQRANRKAGPPILLHIWENAGHGMATDKEVAAEGQTEWLAFTMRLLHLECAGVS